MLSEKLKSHFQTPSPAPSISSTASAPSPPGLFNLHLTEAPTFGLLEHPPPPSKLQRCSCGWFSTHSVALSEERRKTRASSSQESKALLLGDCFLAVSVPLALLQMDDVKEAPSQPINHRRLSSAGCLGCDAGYGAAVGLECASYFASKQDAQIIAQKYECMHS